MRNWILIIVALVMVGSGVTVLVMHQNTVSLPAEQTPALTPSASAQPSGNPLLTATKGQLDKWLLLDCAAQLYLANEFTDEASKRRCIPSVIAEVESDVNIKLTTAQVVDPAVKAHVRQIYGVR